MNLNDNKHITNEQIQNMEQLKRFRHKHITSPEHGPMKEHVPLQLAFRSRPDGAPRAHGGGHGLSVGRPQGLHVIDFNLHPSQAGIAHHAAVDLFMDAFDSCVAEEMDSCDGDVHKDDTRSIILLLLSDPL